MTETADPMEDRLADFTRDKRILLLSLMAVVVGVMSAFVAKALVWLIAVFTNLTFYQRFIHKRSSAIWKGEYHDGQTAATQRRTSSVSRLVTGTFAVAQTSKVPG